MSPTMSRVLQALAARDAAALSSAVQDCEAIDERLPDGESVLFHAVLSGHIDFVETLIAGGADPNFRATEPAEDSLAPTPLELAQQARFLMDWDKYHPIVELLRAYVARKPEGFAYASGGLEAIEARARSWQAGQITWYDRATNWIIDALGRLVSRIPGYRRIAGLDDPDLSVLAALRRAKESSGLDD
jgi:hypothetical protein